MRWHLKRRHYAKPGQEARPATQKGFASGPRPQEFALAKREYCLKLTIEFYLWPTRLVHLLLLPKRAWRLTRRGRSAPISARKTFKTPSFAWLGIRRTEFKRPAHFWPGWPDAATRM